MLTASHVQSLIKREDPLIIDVGCNDGEHTQMFLDLFPGAIVFCFEPDPRAISHWRQKITSPRAHLFEGAIGAKDGTAAWYSSYGWPGEAEKQQRPDGWDLSGSIRRPTGHTVVHPWCKFEQAFDVPVIRLDTWASLHDVHEVDFIWADMQGAEGDLIRGGRKTLAHTQFLYTEYSNQSLYEGQPMLAQLRAMLPEFEMVQMWENDVLFQRKA